MKNTTPDKNKVIVALSGGVDSATAALLLKQRGFEVVGAHMRLWKEKGSALEAKAKNEEENARRVAAELGIGFLVIDLRREFKKAIVDYFLSEYEQGRTPNPCVRCNREIKFGLFAQKALATGADYFATGHYARIKQETREDARGKKKTVYRLRKAKDQNKDQSYFLYNLDQKILKKTLFPLGDLTKTETREIARKNSLFVHDKSESQEVCFVADKYYGEFLKRMRVTMRPGEIVDEAGQVLGEHRGLPLYTLGQRRDIRIGGTGPYFVVGLDYQRNRLVVSSDGASPRLLARRFTLREINWVEKKPEMFPLSVKIKTRYRMEAVAAKLSQDKNRLVVTLGKKSRAVTPGQSAVFYFRDQVWGGGVIDRVLE